MVRLLRVIFIYSLFLFQSTFAVDVSKDFNSFIQSKTPSYCVAESDLVLSLTERECNKLKESEDPLGENSEFLKLSKGLNKASFTQRLTQISINKLLKAKADAYSMFPSLIPKDRNIAVVTNKRFKDKNRKYFKSPKISESKSKSKTTKGCFNRHEITRPELKQINQSDKDNSKLQARQKNLLVTSILDSLNTNAYIEKKNNLDLVLDQLFDERIKMQRKLNNINSVLAGSFHSDQNKKLNRGGLFGGMSTQELMISSQSVKKNHKIAKSLKKSLEKLNKDIEEKLLVKKKLDDVIYKNPITTDASAFFEDGLIKLSSFSQTAIKFVSSQKANTAKSLDGTHFIQLYEKKLNDKKLDKSSLEFALSAQIEDLIERNPKEYERLFKVLRENVGHKVSSIDKSIVEICETDGEKLHHFSPLVQEALDRELIASKNDPSNLLLLKSNFQDNHCSLLKEVPYNDNNILGYGAVGAGMLALGVFTPVGAGVVLAAGGVGFATVGAIESKNALDRLSLSRGLSLVSMAKKEKARSDLSHYRESIGWTAADGLLLPLDMFVIGAKIASKTDDLGDLIKSVNNYKPRTQVEELTHLNNKYKLIEQSNLAYKQRNADLVKAYPQYESLLKDPAAYVKNIEKAFEKQKAITPENPYQFDFSEYGIPTLKKMESDLVAKIAEINQLLSKTSKVKRKKEIETNIKHLKLIQEDLKKILDSGNVNYDELYKISHFYNRAIGLFDPEKFGIIDRLLLGVDRHLQGYAPLSSQAELDLYLKGDFEIFQKQSTTKGFIDAHETFETAAFNPDKLEMILIPTTEELADDIFTRLVPYDIYLEGVTRNPIPADGFLRPGGDFGVHDRRHASAIFFKRKEYEAKHNLSDSQIEDLAKRADLWEGEVEEFIKKLPSQELKSAAKLIMFNHHHDRGVPITPSAYLPESLDKVPYLLHSMLKLSGQDTALNPSLSGHKAKHYALAYKELRRFWLKRLPQEYDIINKRVVRDVSSFTEKLGNQTIIGTSGIEVEGKVSKFIKDKDGKVAYLSTQGPTSLKYANNKIPFQGVKQHPEGFGSPIGRLKNSVKPMENFNNDELVDLGIIVGAKVKLEYASGVVVHGDLKSIKRHAGKLSIMSFKNATVTGPNGEILFSPSWGTYDMTVMDTIVGTVKHD